MSQFLLPWKHKHILHCQFAHRASSRAMWRILQAPFMRCCYANSGLCSAFAFFEKGIMKLTLYKELNVSKTKEQMR